MRVRPETACDGGKLCGGVQGCQPFSKGSTISANKGLSDRKISEMEIKRDGSFAYWKQRESLKSQGGAMRKVPPAEKGNCNPTFQHLKRKSNGKQEGISQLKTLNSAEEGGLGTPTGSNKKWEEWPNA